MTSPHLYRGHLIRRRGHIHVKTLGGALVAVVEKLRDRIGRSALLDGVSRDAMAQNARPFLSDAHKKPSNQPTKSPRMKLLKTVTPRGIEPLTFGLGIQGSPQHGHVSPLESHQTEPKSTRLAHEEPTNPRG